MAVSLFKDLARSNWHSSIMTTYSVDPAFYDGSIAHRLRTYGCENNILLADAVMLKRALAATPEAFQQAGRRYAVVPVRVPGSFHPKIHLRMGSDSARLVVGSANATAAGWGRNHEIVAAIDWKRNDAASASLGPLIGRAYDYLARWLSAIPGDAIGFKLRLHRRDSPWLLDLTANPAPIVLEDGTAIDLLCDRGGDDPAIMESLLRLIDGEVAFRFVVVSPYWDAGLGGLREIRERLNTCPTMIVLNPGGNTFPVAALREDESVTFCAAFDGNEGNRFLHAKVILIQTPKADHVVFGSANCSDDALGGIGRPSRNAEVSIYRRFPPGEGLALLGIDLGRTVEASEIQPPKMTAQLFPGGAGAMPGGSVEIAEDMLTWWPPPHCEPAGARIALGRELLPVTAAGNGQHRALLVAPPVYPLIVRIRFSDGRESDPIIVHDETALRHASPGIADRRIRKAIDKILRGEDDIIDLALNAHILFGLESERMPGGAHGEKRDRPAVEGPDYATPEAFRRGVTLKSATGQSGRFSFEDAGLLDILRLVLRGVVDIGGREARRRADADEDADLAAGEGEDGDEASETAPPDAADPEPPPTRTPRVYTAEEIARRKSQLMKAIDGYEAMLGRLAATPGPVSTRLTAQTAFILQLMLYACTADQARSDGAAVRPMAWAPDSTAEREATFAVRAGRILKRIWVGGTGPPIAARMRVDHRHGMLPDDVFYFIIMSRWAILRAYLGALGTRSARRLAPFLRKTVIEIYTSTLQFGLLDSDAERTAIEKLDAAIGISAAETEALLTAHRAYLRSTGPASLAGGLRC